MSSENPSFTDFNLQQRQKQQQKWEDAMISPPFRRIQPSIGIWIFASFQPRQSNQNSGSSRRWKKYWDTWNKQSPGLGSKSHA
ncbi:hypothetical protein OIU79_031049 [Salix purpurea]|uniref:Uncharacterized protein n=1 Tax=Salix purpurea TaxID=77065 RepID=A0A9Q0ZS54_SALPP|nr:hypothetical protein OIU79_031049 [Salix purpurea]